ncbi:hypothetical protein Pla175_26360 [Pirellulimonas nuda]|uniref:Uncharacterized protein n=1 Tax=Pirellulimonas nuda TaxID=2528009 RepID=A0A518DCQ5_9BACT|nr:hypothetical protein [Pirellulimonas nuda]QDU89249.1 hypothetical protein Pla175_26360 [Pirellulimonas nuda]
MKYLPLALVIVLLSSAVGRASEPVSDQGSVLLDFDDLDVKGDALALTGRAYGGLTWGVATVPGFKGNLGYWLIDDGSDDPYLQGLVNGWGASELRITFPGTVILRSTLAAAQGEAFLQSSAVRFHGYRGETLVGVTPWYSGLVRHEPYPIEFHLPPIDSLVVEAANSMDANENGGRYGAYRIDNLRYVVVPEPTSVALGCPVLSLWILGCLGRRKGPGACPGTGSKPG